MNTKTILFKIYFLILWLLGSIIIALIVVLFPLYKSQEQVRIENEKIFENYELALQSRYWWESSDVWGFKSRANLSACYEYFSLDTLQSSFALPCIPQNVPKYRRYEDVNILWIDASFADDNVDFVDIRNFFHEEWANFYAAQSPGRFPGSWVVRTSSKFIFGGKQILYIFYNERKKYPRYKRAAIIEHIKDHFPDLDEVRLHSFFYYKKALADEPFDSDVGRLMYYIWDCELPEHEYCDETLTQDGKYWLFTQKMINWDLDFFFILPAHGNQWNTSFQSDTWPRQFLQWLFKSNN